MTRGFVILDFETTGLSPKHNDRVLEVGAVFMSEDMRIEGVFETLINPKRDVGPTRVHGVSARDIFDAPTFAEVAPTIVEQFAGRVIVGHNVLFDVRFLSAELEREGYWAPEYVTVDTLHVAKQLLQNEHPASYKLHDLATCLGFSIKDVMQRTGFGDRPEHSALGDAMVTAQLLSVMMQMSSRSNFWYDHLNRAQSVVWPEVVPVSFEAKPRCELRTQSVTTPTNSVSDVFRALGGQVPQKVSTAEYSRLLDDALRDRVLEPHEIDALVESARFLAIDNVTLGSLHRGYFDQVVREAWADGKLTEIERTDIRNLASLLGIDDDSLGEALQEVATTKHHETVDREVRPAGAGALVSPRLAIAPNSLVVLTGEMSRERFVIEAEIVSLGFAIGRNVTKKTALVLAADPYTQSGKAKKARDYGIQVLGEEDGLALLRGL